MYTGTLIDELIKTVQKAETETKLPKEYDQAANFELQLFMQLQGAHNLRHIRVGIA